MLSVDYLGCVWRGSQTEKAVLNVPHYGKQGETAGKLTNSLSADCAKHTIRFTKGHYLDSQMH